MTSRKKERFPGYKLVTTPESGVVTFGTNVWVRDDNAAIRIVFPTGNQLHFFPKIEAFEEEKAKALAAYKAELREKIEKQMKEVQHEFGTNKHDWAFELCLALLDEE